MAIQPFCSGPEQYNKSQCFVRDGDMNSDAWFRCFSAAFNIICRENAWLELPLQSHSVHCPWEARTSHITLLPLTVILILILVVWQNTRPIYIQAQLLHGNLCVAGSFLAFFPSQILQEKSSSFKDFYKEASGLLCQTSMDMFRGWYMDVELPDSH